MKLRTLAPGDIEDVLAILARSPEAAQWLRADCERMALGSGRGWVAEDGGAVVGFVVARCAANEIEILNLAIAPEARRRGVARLLVAEAIAWGESCGAVKAFLEVRESNSAAIRLYESLGFAEAGRRARYYVDPIEDGLMLACRLK